MTRCWHKRRTNLKIEQVIARPISHVAKTCVLDRSTFFVVKLRCYTVFHGAAMSSTNPDSRPHFMTLQQKALLVSALLNVGLLAGHLARGPLTQEVSSNDAPIELAQAPSAQDLPLPGELEAPALEFEGSALAAVVAEAPEAQPAAVPGLAPEVPSDLPDLVPVDAQIVSVSIENNIPASLGRVLDRTLATMLSQELARLLVWNIQPARELRNNDQLTLAWTNDSDGGITIHAMRFQSQRHDRTFDAYRWQADGEAYATWYDSDGIEVAHRLNDGPLAEYDQITSLLRDRPDHEGMDFMTPVGTPVMSPWGGRVTNVDWNLRFNGNCIEVAHDNGLVAKYLHLSATQVQVGDTVQAGQVIAMSGNTGRSTGPHLHYELARSGAIVDPVEAHGTFQRELPDAERSAFEAHIAAWSARFNDQTGG